jgi:hypothetical protein
VIAVQGLVDLLRGRGDAFVRMTDADELAMRMIAGHTCKMSMLCRDVAEERWGVYVHGLCLGGAEVSAIGVGIGISSVLRCLRHLRP